MSPRLIPINKPEQMQAAVAPQSQPTKFLIALTDVVSARARGIPVTSTHQLRWLERATDEKGLRDAFVGIGRRKFIDSDKFHELVRQQPIRS